MVKRYNSGIIAFGLKKRNCQTLSNTGPRLSVALCTYNGAQYLEEQLGSILHQSLPVDEIIICDDRSVDNTAEIAQRFAVQQFPRIEVLINKENLGVKKNFEKALRHCRGDIVFLADQDDIWAYDKVKRTVEYFESKPHKNVVFTNAYLLENNKRTGETAWDKRYFTGALKAKLAEPAEMLRHLLLNWNLATGATMAVRRPALEEYVPFPEIKDHLQDHILALQAATQNALGFIDECLITYRIHPGQQLGFRIRKVPGFLQPLYKAAQKIKKILLSGRRRKAKRAVALALRKFSVSSFPEANEILDI